MATAPGPHIRFVDAPERPRFEVRAAFDTHRGPWILPDGADPEDVVRVMVQLGELRRIAQTCDVAERLAGQGLYMSTVRFAREDSLGVVTLDNPPLNLIGRQVIDELLDAVERIEASDGLRALLLRAEGDVFSAGADVRVFAGVAAAQLRDLIASFVELGRRIESLPFPTVAALHGMCQAGGFELALFCDLICAAEGTMIGLPETRLGIVPLAGGVERVALRAGLTRARTIAISGELQPAEVMAAWGVIDRVLGADEAKELARTIARGPTLAFDVVKKLVRAYAEGGVPAADRLLLEEAVPLFDTHDARNSIETFLASEPGKARFKYEGR
jgi:enoyl-CoA hydratase/carnithine racemase